MIIAENIVKTYKNGNVKVLKDVSLQFENGEFAVILGASGSGKSTLMSVLSGLERPDSGKIEYDGQEITALNDKQLTQFRKREVGFIFQQYYLLAHLNVDKNVRLGADLAGNKDYRRILDKVGLSNKLKSYPSELSGGEQQRVRLRKILLRCFLTSRQARWTRRREGTCSIT